MAEIRIPLGDAVELAELLTFIADWLTTHDNQTITASLDTYLGHHGYTAEDMSSDLHRFVFLLGLSDGEQLFGEPSP